MKKDIDVVLLRSRAVVQLRLHSSNSKIISRAKNQLPIATDSPFGIASYPFIYFGSVHLDSSFKELRNLENITAESTNLTRETA
jgi:hypothetical protein